MRASLNASSASLQRAVLLLTFGLHPMRSEKRAQYENCEGKTNDTPSLPAGRTTPAG
jgi:hypothetical protein